MTPSGVKTRVFSVWRLRPAATLLLLSDTSCLFRFEARTAQGKVPTGTESHFVWRHRDHGCLIGFGSFTGGDNDPAGPALFPGRTNRV